MKVATKIRMEIKSLISCGGANLNQADIESLEKKGLVTDEIIQFFMQAILEYVESQTKDRINMVDPSVSYLIQSLYDKSCLLYTSPSPRDRTRSRMPSSA